MQEQAYGNCEMLLALMRQLSRADVDEQLGSIAGTAEDTQRHERRSRALQARSKLWAPAAKRMWLGGAPGLGPQAEVADHIQYFSEHWGRAFAGQMRDRSSEDEWIHHAPHLAPQNFTISRDDLRFLIEDPKASAPGPDGPPYQAYLEIAADILWDVMQAMVLHPHCAVPDWVSDSFLNPSPQGPRRTRHSAPRGGSREARGADEAGTAFQHRHKAHRRHM